MGMMLAGGSTAFGADYPVSLDGKSLSMEYRADTWEIFTNVEVDRVTFELKDGSENTYRLNGFLSWLNSAYILEMPEATYNPEEGRLYIESGQEIVTRYDMNWALCNMADEEYINTLPIIFQLDEEGVFRHVSSGTYDGSDYCSIGMVLAAEEPGDPLLGTEDEIYMLYLFRSPKFHPYNGSMSYAFVAQNGNEYFMSCDVYTEVNGNNVMMRNWSNTGFDYNVFFTIDPVNKTLTATNQPVLYDPDMMGECVLSEASANGSVIKNGADYRLQGVFTNEEIDGKVQTVATFPTWGCFDEYERNFFVPTTDTIVYFGYDITNPREAGVGGVAEEKAGEDDSYYTLDGVRVVNPEPGKLYVNKGKIIKL